MITSPINLYQKDNIMLNNSRNSSFPVKHGNKSNLLRYFPFTLSPLVLALFLSSNMAYAKNPLYDEFCTSHDARTFGEKSTAVGECSLAAGDGATALGASSDASPTNTAVGFHAHATFDQIYEHHNENSTAVGFNSSAIRANSTAVGMESQSHGFNSTAVGQQAKAYADNSTAVGQNTLASKTGSTAIGINAKSINVNSVALGTDSVTDHDNQVSIGQKITDAATGAVSYTTRTLSNLTDGTDIHDAVNKGQLDSAIAGISSGVSAKEAQKMADTAQHNAVTEAKTHTDTEINEVLKSGSSTAERGFSIGKGAQASGKSSTATGDSAIAKGYASIAIGADSAATKTNSTAIGHGASAIGDFSTATGPSSQAGGYSSIATGLNSQAKGNYSIAIGDRAKAEGTNSLALGSGSVADQDNQVSIGQKITDATTGAVRYITRTLSNLTDGTDAHDAVNKGQLDYVDTKAQGYATTAQSAANKHT
ncbi:hypothetical protein ACNGVM_004872, partial [Salmonella enterica]